MSRPKTQRNRTCLAGLAVVLLGACQQVEPAAAPSAKPETRMTQTGAEMVLIAAGSFQMGSAGGEPDEAPPHEVALDAFWIDRTEVTQAQYGKLVLANPAHFKGDDRPVEQVSWADAALYCNLRSRAEGLEACYDEETAVCDFQASGYRLPTEAEWEYACRAGTTTTYACGADASSLARHAWFADNAGKRTQPAARKPPNAWGLCDMHGNVAEWCNDVYAADYYARSPACNPRGPDDGEKYVLRGGAWNSQAAGCRSATRVGENPGFQDACFARDAIGFRCVRRAAAGPGTDSRAAAGDHATRGATGAGARDAGRPAVGGFVAVRRPAPSAVGVRGATGAGARDAGRPAVGGFVAVGRPAPSVVGRPAPNVVGRPAPSASCAVVRTLSELAPFGFGL